MFGEVCPVKEGVEDIEGVIQDARASGQDISAEYHGRESTPGYQQQERLRLATRSLSISTTHMRDLTREFQAGEPEPDHHRVFYAFRDAHALFGSHPFRHVIEGRLAEAVQRALSHGLSVPAEFHDDYAHFEFQPWNNPRLNYNTPHDLAEKKEEAIPPDWIP